MKMFVLIVFLTISGIAKDKYFPTRTEMEKKDCITKKEYHKKIASGEYSLSPDKNSTKSIIARLESKLWLLSNELNNTKKKLNIRTKTLSDRIQRLESLGCNCEVRCKSKKSRELFEDIEDIISDVESRIYDLENK